MPTEKLVELLNSISGADGHITYTYMRAYNTPSKFI